MQATKGISATTPDLCEIEKALLPFYIKRQEGLRVQYFVLLWGFICLPDWGLAAAAGGFAKSYYQKPAC
ncbi:hypothetical protein LJC63_06760 [Ruminococcaceae bacterium OttesenSCG-928-L11]|nr:hypothetical protein [Ruminococcaceae bacterium OttesenSCG-928-L11]